MDDVPPVLVRHPVPADADRLGEINSMTWRQAYAGIVPGAFLDQFDVIALQRRWRQNLAAPPAGVSYLLAEVDGVVASYAIVGAYRTQQDDDPNEDPTGWGELYAIYTHPDLQGRGAGTAVHDAAVQELQARGFRCAALWMLAANRRSLRWYAARGWRPDGATSQWEGAGEPLDEIRLVRDLAV